MSVEIPAAARAKTGGRFAVYEAIAQQLQNRGFDAAERAQVMVELYQGRIEAAHPDHVSYRVASIGGMSVPATMAPELRDVLTQEADGTWVVWDKTRSRVVAVWSPSRGTDGGQLRLNAPIVSAGIVPGAAVGESRSMSDIATQTRSYLASLNTTPHMHNGSASARNAALQVDRDALYAAGLAYMRKQMGPKFQGMTPDEVLMAEQSMRTQMRSIVMLAESGRSARDAEDYRRDVLAPAYWARYDAWCDHFRTQQAIMSTGRGGRGAQASRGGSRGVPKSSAPGASAAPKASPTITPQELIGKSSDEIRQLAKDKGLVPHPTKPDKWIDPVTGKERLRIDPGHIDKQTGLPYNDPKAAAPHHHAYGPDGKTRIVDPADGNPHIPTAPPPPPPLPPQP